MSIAAPLHPFHDVRDVHDVRDERDDGRDHSAPASAGEVLLDEDNYAFFGDGTGLDLVVEHLGLQAVCEHEGWTGALVGRGLVFITSSSHAEERDRRHYECAFSAGQVEQDFRDEELHLRARLATDAAMQFGYYVNLDERGGFRADVRTSAGQTVFEVLLGNELGEDESSLVDDGFMRHGRDLVGLKEHLQCLGVLPAGAELRDGLEIERSLSNDRQQGADLRLSRAPVFATEPPDVEAIVLAVQACTGDQSQLQARHGRLRA